MGLTATPQSNAQIGWFRIFATPPGGDTTEITKFRGAPTRLGSFSWSDPFGPEMMELEFPQITPWDQPGQGDLSWLVPYTDIDVVWHNTNGATYEWEWEGFVVDETVMYTESSSSFVLQCKGALFQLDNYLAKPSFPQQPIPYEILMREAFSPDEHPGVHTSPMVVEWPAGWSKTMQVSGVNKQWFLRPYGIIPGQKWTGLSTRATGAWENTLTTYVQSMLTVMYDEGGAQWSIRCDRGRVPVMYLRKPPSITTTSNLVVKVGLPGVGIEISRDFTQSANVIYGIGQDIAGATYSGQEVSADGTTTTYEPYAWSATVYPDEENPFFDPNGVRREVQLQFPNGMDEAEAKDVAQAQYYRFADPGFVGTVTLKTDVATLAGTVVPRMLIKAGQSLVLDGFRGGQLLMHITRSEFSQETGVTTLTVDSKFRDALTVGEVKERTRDALSPIRLLKPGAFVPTTQDMLMPWSYQAGSGIMPIGARDLLLNKLKKQEAFPWQKTTRRYPPKDYPHYYVKVSNPNRLTNCNRNWAMRAGNAFEDAAIPIRMSQQGTIRLSQVAAYDEDGNVLPVRFHFAIYDNRGVSVDNMPMIPAGSPKILKPAGATYGSGDYNPFFQDAFEDIKADGSQQSDLGYTATESSGFVMGWGNYYEPAGHSPGLASRGAPKTGKLEDETPWQFSTTTDPNFDPQDPNMKPWKDGVGMLYAMLYCDDYNGPVYFLGRFFRQEPGV